MTTITDTIMAGDQLTTEQKLEVLTDARKFLSDSQNWTQQDYLKVKSKEGPLRQGLFQKVEKDDHLSACVMGAVALSAGLIGEENYHAEQMLMSCSLGTTMLAAIPDVEKLIRRRYETSYDYSRKPVEFEAMLETEGKTVLEWALSQKQEWVAGMIYNYNDAYGRKHHEVLELLDLAIASLQED